MDFDGLDHIGSHQAPYDRGVFIVHELGDTGTALDLANAGTTNAYNFGKAVATRYAGYPNIVWHVMGDFRCGSNSVEQFDRVLRPNGRRWRGFARTDRCRQASTMWIIPQTGHSTEDAILNRIARDLPACYS